MKTDAYRFVAACRDIVATADAAKGMRRYESLYTNPKRKEEIGKVAELLEDELRQMVEQLSYLMGMA